VYAQNVVIRLLNAKNINNTAINVGGKNIQIRNVNKTTITNVRILYGIRKKVSKNAFLKTPFIPKSNMASIGKI
jgi:hypothetical protein